MIRNLCGFPFKVHVSFFSKVQTAPVYPTGDGGGGYGRPMNLIKFSKTAWRRDEREKAGQLSLPRVTNN